MENLDPLKVLYKPIAHIPFVKGKTALLVVDMQYLDAAPGYGLFAKAAELGVESSLDYYFNRLQEHVIPNIRRLQEAFRMEHLEVIHTKIESLTQDGRDRSPEHKLLGLHAPKGSKEADFLEEVKPIGDEIVFSKTASGIFGSTNIEYVLRNLGIEYLVITGVVTNECIENAVRMAADLGFLVTLPEDACAALTKELHENAIDVLGHTYARVVSTDQVLNELKRPSEVK
ncbi:cysteine hydrolase family protein [Aneurinibacillus tyrosinisolvens]|uniref:cysteine hydrolase family protein n=1 Tax=Aneurinibacillus tyrosinisolvens TaxID=1443435 RepID=UPI000AC08DD8|nr:isochorismatase family cysteine hydrolase [Aneurinibacillus tyrosinisolvens]